MLIEISCDEDGDIRVSVIDNVSAYLAELSESGSLPEFFSNIEQVDSNPMYWGRKRLLIKGDIVAPKPKQVVTEYSIGGNDETVCNGQGLLFFQRKSGSGLCNCNGSA